MRVDVFIDSILRPRLDYSCFQEGCAQKVLDHIVLAVIGLVRHLVDWRVFPQSFELEHFNLPLPAHTFDEPGLRLGPRPLRPEGWG